MHATTFTASNNYPKPRALKPVRTTLTGLAHALISKDAAYWCLIIRNQGTERIHGGRIQRTNNTDDQLTSAALLEALEHAVEIAGENHISLYINDKTVRSAIAGLGLNNITLEARIQDGDLEKALAYTADLAGTTIAAVTPINSRALTWEQKDAQRARNALSNAPVTVSSDASMGRRTKDAGMGFVIDWPEEEPFCGSSTAKAPNILAAELLAIENAVKEVLKTVHSRRPIRFNSDSQIAIDGINAAREGRVPPRMSSPQIAIVDRIVHLGAQYNFTFTWVKGHNGNALNEVADSLAVTARRCKEMGTSAEARQHILEGIKNSVRLPLAS